MKLVETLLKTQIGLDVTSIGASVVERTVRLRMKALGMKSLDEYNRLLEISAHERLELIESVVVNETWFFRDPESFVAFTRLALERLPAGPDGFLRILSVPCASGEEPYSLAMSLLDAGLTRANFAVEAVDISARALAKARRALFGKNSFRGKKLEFREHFLQDGRDIYALDPKVCGCVQFYQDNLLGENFLPGRDPYDFIFCRNLLIYFDRPTQARALARLSELLADDGVLFVGPAELPICFDQGFVSADMPMAFACRKPNAGDTARLRRGRSFTLSDTAVSLSSPTLGNIVVNGHGQPSVTKVPADLSLAQKLADEGQLPEAGAICEEYLRQQGPSVQAYYLLGLVRDAAGDADAADFYRKALYLDPNHYETLWHMALLAEKKGDAAGARTFKRRAERAQSNGAPKT